MASATITKSSAAPTDAETFSIGQIDFNLNDKSPEFVTEDPSVIASAKANSFLTVVLAPEPVDPNAPIADPNDPQVNFEADHLSALASPASIAAATANQAAIEEITSGQQNVAADSPTIAETLNATFNAIGVQTAPVLPEAEAAPAASAPAPTVTSPTPTPAVAGSSSASPAPTPTVTSPTPAVASSSSASPAPTTTTGSN
jgi:hypothetical protein